MFGLPLVLPDDAMVDRIIDRVLTHDRVELIAQRVVALLLEQQQPTPPPGRKPPADKSGLSFDSGLRTKRR